MIPIPENLALFAVAAFILHVAPPQFVDPAQGAVTAQFLFLGLLFVSMAFVTDSAYALLTGALGHRLKTSAPFVRAKRYVAGTIYVGLGLAAALAPSESK